MALSPDNKSTSAAPLERAYRVEALFEPLEVRAFTASATSELIADLADEERVALQPMVATRQAEFATARACARAALGQLGISGAIPKGEGGAPLWPAGATGSISHTKGFCVAVAAAQPSAVGLDAELVGRMKPSIERRILGEVEQRRLVGVEGHDRRLRVASIFAAKEAFYKAYNEIESRYFGFDAVVVTIEADRLSFGRGSGVIAEEVLRRTSGRFHVEHGRVIAGVTIASAGDASPLRSPA